MQITKIALFDRLPEPACGHRVPIRLLRIYDLVDLDASVVGKDHAAVEKLVPITRQ